MPATPSAGVICLFVDVDERHRARESLQQQAERTRAILDSVLVGIVTVSRRRHRVDEPLGAAHVRRRAGGLRRRADRHRRHRRAPSTRCAARDYAGAPGRRPGRDLRVPVCSARDGREFWVVGNAVVTGATSGDAAASSPSRCSTSSAGARPRSASRRRRPRLQRVIETAPLAIALFDARSLRVLQAQPDGQRLLRTAARAGRWARPARRPGSAAAARRRCANGCRPPGHRVLRREVRDRRELRDAERRRRAGTRVWDARIVALAGSGRLGWRGAVAAGGQRRHRAACGRARPGLQAAIAAARSAGARGAPPHQEQPAGRGRAAAAECQPPARGGRCCSARRWARCRRSPRSTACRSGATGPLRVSRVLLGAVAGSVQRTFGRAIAVGAERPRCTGLRPARGRSDPGRADPQRTADQRRQALRAEGDIRCAACRRRGPPKSASATRASLREGFDLAQAACGRLRPRPGACAAAQAQRDAGHRAAGRRGRRACCARPACVSAHRARMPAGRAWRATLPWHR
ncbi:MAG: hypothetical protein MZW92_72110 [Comamonadaceae bacterium]|nr:hypothetical protein [Comamonadaceae bacterium]